MSSSSPYINSSSPFQLAQNSVASYSSPTAATSFLSAATSSSSSPFLTATTVSSNPFLSPSLRYSSRMSSPTNYTSSNPFVFPTPSRNPMTSISRPQTPWNIFVAHDASSADTRDPGPPFPRPSLRKGSTGIEDATSGTARNASETTCFQPGVINNPFLVADKGLGPLGSPFNTGYVFNQAGNPFNTKTQPVEMLRAKSNPKIPLPSKFSGAAKDYRDFVTSVKFYIRSNSDTYWDDVSKISLFGGLMTGTALSWFLELVRLDGLEVYNYRMFLEACDRTFMDPNFRLKQQNKLDKLTQGSRTVHVYALEFKSIAPYTSYNEGYFITAFRRGLSEPIKDMLTYADSPNTFEELVNLAIRMDLEFWKENYLGLISRSPPNRRLIPRLATPLEVILPKRNVTDV